MDRPERITARLLIAIGSMALFMVQAGCAPKRDEPAQITTRDKTYTLLPAAEAKPVDLKDVELIGCSDADRRSIAQCLGQIPTSLRIRRIEMAWAENPIAVRVSVGPDCYIYLQRSKERTWSIKNVVLWNR